MSSRPRHWRLLVGGYATLVAALTFATAFVVLVGPTERFAALYDLLIVGVLFTSPAVVAVAVAVLGGGLLQAVGAGAVPSLAWALAVVVARALAGPLGIPLPTPDSPLWAVTGAFLAIGTVSAFGGFLLARAGLLAWRRR